MSESLLSDAVTATGRTLSLVALLALAACSTAPPRTVEPAPIVSAGAAPPPAPERPPPPASAPAADSTFERQGRQKAEELMQAGRWAEAAAQWEILTLLRPERREYVAKLTEAQGLAADQASKSLAAAAEARKRGDLQRAATLYLTALSADPHDAMAAEGLRELEREQGSRAYSNHAARASAGARGTRATRAPYSADREELDTAVMLLHQGDYSASVQNLQSYLKRYPHDETGKRALRDAYAALGKQRIAQGKKEEGVSYLEKASAIKSNGGAELDTTTQAARKDLAQDYYEQGLRSQRTDLDAAIRLWDRCLEYDPGHAQCRLRLDQARRMQETLKSLPGAESMP